MPYPIKPDPAQEGADKIHDALKGVPSPRRGETQPVGQIFKGASDKSWRPIDNGPLGRRVADALGGISDADQRGAIDHYNKKPERTHEIDMRPMEGGQAITVEKKKAPSFTPSF